MPSFTEISSTTNGISLVSEPPKKSRKKRQPKVVRPLTKTSTKPRSNRWINELWVHDALALTDQMMDNGHSYTDVFTLVAICTNVLRYSDHTRPISLATLKRNSGGIARSTLRKSARRLEITGYLRVEGEDREERTYYPLLQQPDRTKPDAQITAPTTTKPTYPNPRPKPAKQPISRVSTMLNDNPF